MKASLLHVCLLSKSFRFCLTILMCPVSYLMPSGYLSNSGTKSKERLACTYGGWSWQRNGLALPPFWLESCPCKIAPAEVWKRKGSCISCNFYRHGPQKEFILFQIRGRRLLLLWSYSTTGDGAGGTVQKENQLQADVSGSCCQGRPRFEVPHHPRVLHSTVSSSVLLESRPSCFICVSLLVF